MSAVKMSFNTGDRVLARKSGSGVVWVVTGVYELAGRQVVNLRSTRSRRTCTMWSDDMRVAR